MIPARRHSSLLVRPELSIKLGDLQLQLHELFLAASEVCHVPRLTSCFAERSARVYLLKGCHLTRPFIRRAQHIIW